MVTIRPVLASDADLLFPFIDKTSVTETLRYDGPESLDDFRARIGEFAEQTAAGKRHLFTILVDGEAAGNVGIRPYVDGFRADIGIWIGMRFQGRGVGTKAIQLVSEYGFERLGLEKIEAFVYVGNEGSRRAFEKNGFHLEGTVRCAARKRGRYRDEWMLGILREEWEAVTLDSGILADGAAG